MQRVHHTYWYPTYMKGQRSDRTLTTHNALALATALSCANLDVNECHCCPRQLLSIKQHACSA
jgi:hypothetical protein